MGKDKKEYNFVDVLTNGVLLDKILEIRRDKAVNRCKAMKSVACSGFVLFRKISVLLCGRM